MLCSFFQGRTGVNKRGFPGACDGAVLKQLEDIGFSIGTNLFRVGFLCVSA